MPRRRTISQEIKRIRNKLQLSQEELAQKYNKRKPSDVTTTQYDISRYESGKTTPPANKYQKFLNLIK